MSRGSYTLLSSVITTPLDGNMIGQNVVTKGGSPANSESKGNFCQDSGSDILRVYEAEDMVSSSLHLSHSNFRSNESPFGLLEPTWLVDDGGCYHSGNRGMQRSHKLSRSRYRRVDDADTSPSSPFGTNYA